MFVFDASQCTYRCVVLPDSRPRRDDRSPLHPSQCTYRCVVLPDRTGRLHSTVPTGCLNAPTGAWCSLTMGALHSVLRVVPSQCTYRCVVLPDRTGKNVLANLTIVSMHLQVRGAP